MEKPSNRGLWQIVLILPLLFSCANKKTIVHTEARVFFITVGGSKNSKALLDAAKFASVSPMAKEYVLSHDFPIENGPPRNTKLLILDFKDNLRADQILARLSKLRLKQPEPEDALRFAEKYPDEVRKHSPIAFLHRPYAAAYQGVRKGMSVTNILFGFLLLERQGPSNTLSFHPWTQAGTPKHFARGGLWYTNSWHYAARLPVSK